LVSQPHLDALKGAVQEFERMYPDLPVSPPLGARNRWSSYLHVAVNALELRATELYVGHQRARDVLAQWQYYRAPIELLSMISIASRRCSSATQSISGV
jgi:hypothetical protein